jgi:spectinomycin phosphotransferase
VAEFPGGYAVSVYPFLVGESHPYGHFATDEERRVLLAALGEIHRAKPAVLPAADRLEVPDRAAVAALLSTVEDPPAAGPYAAEALALLHDRAGLLGELLAEYDSLRAPVAASQDGWVVTHGEPHAGNVMRPVTGGIRLIDWDTVALAPRERDLWMVQPRDPDDWAAYGEPGPADPAALALFKLRWRLADICSFAVTLTGPHEDTEDTRLCWRGLSSDLRPASPADWNPAWE